MLLAEGDIVRYIGKGYDRPAPRFPNSNDRGVVTRVYKDKAYGRDMAVVLWERSSEGILNKLLQSNLRRITGLDVAMEVLDEL